MIVTLVRVDNGLPFVQRATMVQNADGSTSFQLDGGLFVGQTPWLVGQPSTYGVRYPDSDQQGAYQRGLVSGNTVTFLTRPEDIPCVYLLGQGQAF